MYRIKCKCFFFLVFSWKCRKRKFMFVTKMNFISDFHFESWTKQRNDIANESRIAWCESDHFIFLFVKFLTSFTNDQKNERITLFSAYVCSFLQWNFLLSKQTRDIRVQNDRKPFWMCIFHTSQNFYIS